MRTVPARPSRETPPIVLLDVMGTLVHDPFFVEVPRALGMTLAQVIEQKHPTAWVEFERDDLNEQQFLDRFFEDGRRYDQAALKRSFSEAFRYLDGIEPLLQELNGAGRRPHLLSNYPCWFELIERRLALSRYADWTFVSCRTRRRKPEPGAFLHAARSLGVAPGDCLFVDDHEQNVTAAARVGMNAVRFKDAPALRQELRRFGALP
jgi:HAD superfamily hydrolase (TIGR01509 family)